MKLDFSSFGIPENGFGVLFPVNNFLCSIIFHVYGKRKNAYFHVETASSSRQT